MTNQPSSQHFSFRLSYHDLDQATLIGILKLLPRGKRTAYIVEALLQYERMNLDRALVLGLIELARLAVQSGASPQAVTQATGFSNDDMNELARMVTAPVEGD